MANLVTLLNEFKRKRERIGRISDMKVDYAYEIVKFRRISTICGVVVIAQLKYHGPTYFYDTHPKCVFLPKRYSEVLTEEKINEYDSSKTRMNVIYRGLINGRHEMDFI